MTIGERIKQRRLQLGLTVEQVADTLGKNRATIYRYECDYIYQLPVTVLEPLAKVLQCTPAYLMGWDDTENKITEDKQPLTENQKEIVSIFDRLTEEKQNKVIGFASALLPEETEITEMPYKVAAFGGANKECKPPIKGKTI